MRGIAPLNSGNLALSLARLKAGIDETSLMTAWEYRQRIQAPARMRTLHEEGTVMLTMESECWCAYLQDRRFPHGTDMWKRGQLLDWAKLVDYALAG